MAVASGVNSRTRSIACSPTLGLQTGGTVECGMGKGVSMTESNQPMAAESEGASLIMGDFYSGAYGPTIILILVSRAAGTWFQEILRTLASGGPARILTSDPRVCTAHVDEIEMTTRSAEPRVALKHSDSGSAKSFIWSATRDGWLYLADLTQPLCTDGVGHHYLTDDEDDDALIELSFGEHAPQKIAMLTKGTQHRPG